MWKEIISLWGYNTKKTKTDSQYLKSQVNICEYNSRKRILGWQMLNVLCLLSNWKHNASSIQAPFVRFLRQTAFFWGMQRSESPNTSCLLFIYLWKWVSPSDVADIIRFLSLQHKVGSYDMLTRCLSILG